MPRYSRYRRSYRTYRRQPTYSSVPRPDLGIENPHPPHIGIENRPGPENPLRRFLLTQSPPATSQHLSPPDEDLRTAPPIGFGGMIVSYRIPSGTLMLDFDGINRLTQPLVQALNCLISLTVRVTRTLRRGLFSARHWATTIMRVAIGITVYLVLVLK